MKLTYIIDPKKNERWQQVLEACITEIRALALSGRLMVVLSDVIRSLDQNAKMWPMLKDFADCVAWPIDGVHVMLDPDDWKALLTAAFEEEMRMAPGLHGGTVMLGARTSGYTVGKMSQFIEFMYAEGSQRGVIWSERSREHIERYTKVRF
jgi:hypothetical protein